MIIIGERINTSRKGILRAVEAKDAGEIASEARKQVEAGAHFVDVNCGTRVATEPEDMEWLVRTVQSAVDVPLCIDSPNPAALEKGLRAHNGRAIVNSITGEKERCEAILPLVKEHGAAVIGLTMDESGMPRDAKQRAEIAENIVKIAARAGIPEERIFFDALVRPISAEPEQAAEFLKSLEMIKSIGNVRTVCGLSNISFGLPKRKVINSVFLAMAVARGLDCAIIDPTEPVMLAAARASDAIMGKDEYCMSYITSCREGHLDNL